MQTVEIRMNLVHGFFFFFNHGSFLIFEITSMKSDYYLKRLFKMNVMFIMIKSICFCRLKENKLIMRTNGCDQNLENYFKEYSISKKDII